LRESPVFSGGSAGRFLLNPGSQVKALNILIDVTDAIDQKYGTTIAWDLVGNLLGGSLNIYP
jgi:hypothetical protein